jgi:hypothetical protein
VSWACSGLEFVAVSISVMLCWLGLVLASFCVLVVVEAGEACSGLGFVVVSTSAMGVFGCSACVDRMGDGLSRVGIWGSASVPAIRVA